MPSGAPQALFQTARTSSLKGPPPVLASCMNAELIWKACCLDDTPPSLTTRSSLKVGLLVAIGRLQSDPFPLQIRNQSVPKAAPRRGSVELGRTYSQTLEQSLMSRRTRKLPDQHGGAELSAPPHPCKAAQDLARRRLLNQYEAWPCFLTSSHELRCLKYLAEVLMTLNLSWFTGTPIKVAMPSRTFPMDRNMLL